MKKIILVIIVLSPFLKSFSQVPADSIPGHYIGEYWFRIENEPWTIRIDTINVISFEETTCYCYYIDWDESSRYHAVITEYNYCMGTPINLFTLFHSGDSVTEIFDNYSTPPPDPELRSHRFYGKKAWINTSIKEGKQMNKEHMD